MKNKYMHDTAKQHKKNFQIECRYLLGTTHTLAQAVGLSSLKHWDSEISSSPLINIDSAQSDESELFYIAFVHYIYSINVTTEYNANTHGCTFALHGKQKTWTQVKKGKKYTRMACGDSSWLLIKMMVMYSWLCLL